MGSLTASASYIDFQFQVVPGQNPQPQTQVLTITSTGSQPVNLTVLIPQNPWMQVTVSGYVTPAQLTITMAPGFWNVSMDVLAISGAGGILNIPIHSVYWPSGGGLSMSPGALEWSYTPGGAAPASSVEIEAVGVLGGAPLYYVTAASEGNWLRINGTWLYADSPLLSKARVRLEAVTPPVLPGTYTGTVKAYAKGNLEKYSYSSFTVTLTVKAAGNPRPGVSSLTYDYQIGGPTPAPQSVPVTSDNSALNFAASVTAQPAGWLAVSANSGTTPASLSVSVNPAGLAPGIYSGTLNLSAGSGAVISVPVALTVRAATPLSAPANLTFTSQSGNPLGSLQAVQLTGAAGSSFTTQVTEGSGWLSVSPSSGTLPATVSVSANPTGLGPGSYSGTIVITATGASAGQVSIRVAYTVAAPLPTLERVLNAASYAGGKIAPGELVTLFGRNMAASGLSGLALDASGNVSTIINGVRVTFNGIAAPLLYVSDSQIGAVAPYELAGIAEATVLTYWNGQSSNGITLPVAGTVPGIFTADASGSGPAAVVNQDGKFNSAENPAAKGSTVIVYVTGEGQTLPRGVTGRVTTVAAEGPLTPVPVFPVSMTIDGLPAKVTFAGEAPGFVSGVMQMNVEIPAGVSSGAVPIVVSVGPNSSQGGATVAVR